MDYISINGAPPIRCLFRLSERLARLARHHEDSLASTAAISAPAKRLPSVAIVNEAFAKQYFNGENPVGKSFDRGDARRPAIRTSRSSASSAMPARGTACAGPSCRRPTFRSHSVDAQGAYQPKAAEHSSCALRSANPLALASILRQEVSRARSEFRVSNIRTQTGDQRVTHHPRTAAGHAGAVLRRSSR